MRRRAELLDVVEVAAVDYGEDSEQALEDGHRRLLEVLGVRGVWKKHSVNVGGKKSQHRDERHQRRREQPQKGCFIRLGLEKHSTKQQQYVANHTESHHAASAHRAWSASPQ